MNSCYLQNYCLLLEIYLFLMTILADFHYYVWKVALLGAIKGEVSMFILDRQDRKVFVEKHICE